MTRLATASFAALVLFLHPSISNSAALAEDTCPCLEEAPPGVIWRGSEPLGLEEIAHMAAPVLWYSRDEPLLEPDGSTTPQAHPCDEPSTGPIVYYQVAQIAHHGVPVGRPEEDDPDFFEKVDRMILAFYFYYREDIGLGAHPHDLEVVEFEISLEKQANCYQVRIAAVTGLAHGSRWYANKLEVTADTKFPLTIFVEEGKHGSAPDRNADGQFTRGYDVNHTVNDAWGVRDVMGSGVLLSSGHRIGSFTRK